MKMSRKAGFGEGQKDLKEVRSRRGGRISVSRRMSRR